MLSPTARTATISPCTSSTICFSACKNSSDCSWAKTDRSSQPTLATTGTDTSIAARPSASTARSSILRCEYRRRTTYPLRSKVSIYCTTVRRDLNPRFCRSSSSVGGSPLALIYSWMLSSTRFCFPVSDLFIGPIYAQFSTCLACNYTIYTSLWISEQNCLLERNGGNYNRLNRAVSCTCSGCFYGF